jgi:mycothiol synthase
MTNPRPIISTIVLEHLDATQVDQVTQLIDRATEFDGVRPLSEHAWLHLRSGESGLHVLGMFDDQISGYAHVDVTDLVEGTSAEIVVSPHARNRGMGHALVEQALKLSPDGRLRLWAHGLTTGAQSLADSLGFVLSRSLWQMRRSLFAPLPPAQIPDGVTIRTFDPVTDIAGVLAVNARAFADLPDQGSWTKDDILTRLEESWFNADGFFIAVDTRTDAIIGFHWTKVHGSQVHASHAHDPAASGPDHSHEAIGEVYVLAVDPENRVPGLGRALSALGLTYLRSLGLRQAMLYVDSSNERAISLYEGLRFVHWDTDVMYRHPIR